MRGEHVVDVLSEGQPGDTKSKADDAPPDNIDRRVHAEINTAVANANTPQHRKGGQHCEVVALRMEQQVGAHANAVQAVGGGKSELFGMIVGDAHTLHTCSGTTWEGREGRGLQNSVRGLRLSQRAEIRYLGDDLYT